MERESDITRVKVEINGENYYIKGAASEEHIKQIAAYVDQKMRSLSKANPRLNRINLAVLTAINIADEFLRLKAEYDEFLELLEDEKS
ncbi:cell division protein ZapA [Thermosediminibacter oceani]|uniref:Cell division protein ZapA n=1 Tax=Thermosediminibacter oceani (strain ATCC BAA-1034 / DSM 16646 / JW/IW-1228P) TaxID=555079 RepID=D9RXS6_THEOJ|nr:cell division protein ZapA [Thermosediminibacter oceani]ADL08150.1 cell division protein ZapA [Thermosediminibacter oceani DSM 16646]